MARFNLEIPDRDIPWEDWLLFAGQRMAHNFYVYHLISKALLAHRVESIIEIGTQYGALTCYLGLWGARLDVPVHTFDIEPNLSRDVHWAFKKLGVTLHDEDVFTEDGQALVRLCIGSKPTYLICDGGDKPREWRTFAPMIPAGSLISVHDYGEEFTKEDFGCDPPVGFDYLDGPESWTTHEAKFATVLKLGEGRE